MSSSPGTPPPVAQPAHTTMSDVFANGTSAIPDRLSSTTQALVASIVSPELGSFTSPLSEPPSNDPTETD